MIASPGRQGDKDNLSEFDPISPARPPQGRFAASLLPSRAVRRMLVRRRRNPLQARQESTMSATPTPEAAPRSRSRCEADVALPLKARQFLERLGQLGLV